MGQRLLPWTAKIVDEISLIKTVWTEAINHDPAVTYICTGHQLPGRASLGSWLSYGLGTMNQNLPAFVVMTASWSSKAAAQALYNPALVRGLPAQQVPGSGPALEGRSGALPVHCYNVVENPAHIHDLNATILHCLGIDHRRLSFKFQGLDMRLTGVEEHSPIKGILV